MDIYKNTDMQTLNNLLLSDTSFTGRKVEGQEERAERGRQIYASALQLFMCEHTK